MESCIATCTYNHLGIGVIHVKVHGTARSITARWRGVELHVVVPVNCPMSVYKQFIARNKAELLRRRPSLDIAPGRIIDGNFADFTVDTRALRPGTAVHVEFNDSDPQRGKLCNVVVSVDTDIYEQYGGGSYPIAKALNDGLLYAARVCTSRYIVPHAGRLATALGLAPAGWQVKESKRKLGSCSSKGMIVLSPRLIFLPEDLRDFVIYHELAHLSQMNHSAAFHSLCDSYCGGREKELDGRLDAFTFPVF